MMNYEMIMNSE